MEKLQKSLGLVLFLGVVPLTLLLTGCTTADVKPMKKVENAPKFQYVKVFRMKKSAKLPAEVQKLFDDSLYAVLYGKEGFKHGKELKLTYEVVKYDPGSRSARYWSSGIGGAGKGKFKVIAKYSHYSGKLFSKIEIDSNLHAKFFGGNFNDAVKRAAEEVASYAIKNFKRMK